MDSERPGKVHTPVRVDPAPGSRWIGVGMAIVLAAIAVAVVKPWAGAISPSAPPVGSDADPVRPVGSLVVTAVPPSPSEGPDATAGANAVEQLCLGPLGWRVMADAEWAMGGVRVWMAVSPVRATAPTDGQIAFVHIVGRRIPALGFCAPAVGEDMPTATEAVTIWALRSGLPVQLTPVPIQPSVGSSLGTLWAPPDESAAGWAPGRYAIRVGSGSVARWLGASVELSGH